MTSHASRLKKATALALALGAVAPTAASARVALDPAPQAARPSSEPTVQVIRASAPGGFDWGDAGIGAAGGVGIAMLGVGGALVIAGVRRNDPGPVQPRWSRPDRGLS
jgi:hypothetical protein